MSRTEPNWDRLESAMRDALIEGPEPDLKAGDEALSDLSQDGPEPDLKSMQEDAAQREDERDRAISEEWMRQGSP
jgi:hypothetical protein